MRIKNLTATPLSLTNDGTLSLFWVGVGSAFSKRHYQTNLLIIKGKDHLLIDCGTKTPQALYELGLKITDIKTFFITHSHADHIGGLEEAMLMGRYVARQKPSICITPTYQNLLWDMSLRGGAAFNEERAGSILTFGDMWNIIQPTWLNNYPRETYDVNVGSINIKLFRTMHIPEQPESWQSSFWSCGVIIDDRVMFTSDTRYDPNLLETYDALFPLEAIFHDCQFFVGGVHAGLDELTELPESVRRRMVLVHYGDNWEDNEKKVQEGDFLGLAKQWHFYEFPS